MERGRPAPAQRRIFLAAGLAVAIWWAFHGLGDRFPGAVAEVFTQPAASLGAMLLGAQSVALGGGVFQIDHPALAVQVTPACSGFEFFALAAAVVAGRAAYRHGARLSLRSLPRDLLLVYAVTLLANAARVTTAFHGRRWLAGLLPADMAGAVHLAAGVGTFLPALILTYAFLERRTADARQTAA